MSGDNPITTEDRHPFVDLFSDYYDGELSGDTLAEFETELENNASLRTEYEAFERSLSLLHSLDFSFAPEDFVQEVTQDINRQTHGNFFREGLFGYRVPYEVFAALLLAIFGALYLFGLQAEKGYQVSDPPPDMPSIDRVPDPRGEALGSVEVPLSIRVDARVDLGMAARGLRNDGFAVRAGVSPEGADVLYVEVPVKQLDRFAKRATPLLGRDLSPDVAAYDGGKDRVVTVEIVHRP